MSDTTKPAPAQSVTVEAAWAAVRRAVLMCQENARKFPRRSEWATTSDLADVQLAVRKYGEAVAAAEKARADANQKALLELLEELDHRDEVGILGDVGEDAEARVADAIGAARALLGLDGKEGG